MGILDVIKGQLIDVIEWYLSESDRLYHAEACTYTRTEHHGYKLCHGNGR